MCPNGCFTRISSGCWCDFSALFSEMIPFILISTRANIWETEGFAMCEGDVTSLVWMFHVFSDVFRLSTTKINRSRPFYLLIKPQLLNI